MDVMAIYNKLPIFAQNIACYYEGRRIKKNRYGKIFWEYLNEYESHNNWSFEQLCEYRDKKLQRILKHCYETVPYYTKLFNEGGINYQSIKTLDDLKVLPILTKKIVNENYNDFISTTIPKNKMLTAHTSGTTGSGFIFKTTKEAICQQWAVWWRYRRNLGIEFETRCGLFGGKVIVPITQTHPPYWRNNSPNQQVYFSAFHESENNLYSYYNEINDKGLKWIHGFPSLLSLLANYMNKNKLKFSYNVEFVTTGAENLSDNQRVNIETAFGAKVYQHYGLAEGVSNFSQDINGDMYIDEDFAISEFIPSGVTICFLKKNLHLNAEPINSLCRVRIDERNKLANSNLDLVKLSKEHIVYTSIFKPSPQTLYNIHFRAVCW